MNHYKNNPNCDPNKIIEINFSSAFQDTASGYKHLQDYMIKNNIPEIITFDIPKNITIELARSVSHPELNGIDAIGHIESIKPDLVAIEHVYSPRLAKDTVGYYVLRLYLHELLTGEYNDVYEPRDIKVAITKTTNALADYVVDYADYLLSEDCHGYVAYLFKNSFVFKIKIGPVDLIRYSEYTVETLIDNQNDALQHDIEQRLQEIEERIIDEFLKHDEIVLASNKDLRDALAKKIYINSPLQKEMPIKASRWYWGLGHMLQKAQAIYETDILPEKIEVLLSDGLTQKQIVELTGLSTAKVRNITKALKLKGID